MSRKPVVKVIIRRAGLLYTKEIQSCTSCFMLVFKVSANLWRSWFQL